MSPSPTTGTTEDIIEKKDTSPLATTCILLATAALVAAIVFQLIEISELRRDLDLQAQQTLGTQAYDAVIREKVAVIASEIEKVAARAVIPQEDLEAWQRIADGDMSAGTSSPPGGIPGGLTPPPTDTGGLLETPPGDTGDFGDFSN